MELMGYASQQGCQAYTQEGKRKQVRIFQNICDAVAPIVTGALSANMIYESSVNDNLEPVLISTVIIIAFGTFETVSKYIAYPTHQSEVSLLGRIKASIPFATLSGCSLGTFASTIWSGIKKTDDDSLIDGELIIISGGLSGLFIPSWIHQVVDRNKSDRQLLLTSEGVPKEV